MSLSKIAIPTLMNTGDNWSQWAFVARGYAYGLSAERILIGAELMPITTSNDIAEIAKTEKLAAAFDLKKRALYAYLTSTQSAETMILIQEVDPGDVAACWKILNDHFESKSKASIKQMVSKLTTLRQTDYTGVTEFVHDVTHRIVALKRALLEQKVELIDVLGCSVLLDGLSSDYSALSTHLLLNDTLNFDDLKKRVLEHGERLRYEISTDVNAYINSGTAMKATNVPLPDGNGWLTEPAVCKGCGKLTKHTERICFRAHPHLKAIQESTALAKSVSLATPQMTLAQARLIVAQSMVDGQQPGLGEWSQGAW
jgi:hypothetical protein